MIAGELRRFLRDHSALRVSRSMRDTAYKVLQAKEKLCAETGREPTVEELSAATGIARREIVFALDAICEPVSLYEPVFGDGGESACIMEGSHRPSFAARAAYPLAAFLRRTDADGGRPPGRHLPGSGVAARKGRDRADQKGAFGIKNRGGIRARRIGIRQRKKRYFRAGLR